MADISDPRPVLDDSHRRPGGYGLIPRDWDEKPAGHYAEFSAPFPDSLLVPENEIDGRIQELNASKSTLFDLRNANYSILQSLDQNGFGLCWAFSSTKAMIYLRCMMGEPGKILSAWYTAGMEKGWRDQGGEGGESLQRLAKNGTCEMSFCPSYSSRYATPEAAANAALHKALLWWECSQDPDKAWHQWASAYVSLPFGQLSVQDFDWLSHSMCVPILHSYSSPHSSADNSWGASSGDRGLYDLKGNKAKPNGCWIPRTTMPAAA